MDSFIKLSNFGKIAPYAQLFRQGLLVTVLLSLFTVAIGFVLALILALMRMSNIRPFRALAVDRNGHLREGGPLVWLSKFNPTYSIILNCTGIQFQTFSSVKGSQFPGDFFQILHMFFRSFFCR